MNTKTQSALNDQIQTEFSSAYLYLGMAAYCESLNFLGAASWMKAQANEEIAHGMKLFDYVHQKGGDVTLKALPAPSSRFKSIRDVFALSLKHEESVTQKIHALYELALKEKDYSLQVLLHWFIDEQNEEEAQLHEIIAKFDLIGSKEGLLLMDKELSSRTAAGA